MKHRVNDANAIAIARSPSTRGRDSDHAYLRVTPPERLSGRIPLARGLLAKLRIFQLSWNLFVGMEGTAAIRVQWKRSRVLRQGGDSCEAKDGRIEEGMRRRGVLGA